MSYPDATVFIVDDDQQARDSVRALVRSMGVAAVVFTSAEEFLEAYDATRPGCLVTDYRLLGMNGLDLCEALTRQDSPLPFIVLTAHARTSLTVRAMQTGALTVLDKPYHDDELWEAICSALVWNTKQLERKRQIDRVKERLDTLTPAEHEVLKLLLQGMANKQIAKALKVSLRTVEGRRHEIMMKTEAESLPDLFRMMTLVLPVEPVVPADRT
jgi:two-component system, LuxR family, response regulator FixJ